MILAIVLVGVSYSVGLTQASTPTQSEHERKPLMERLVKGMDPATTPRATQTNNRSKNLLQKSSFAC